MSVLLTGLEAKEDYAIRTLNVAMKFKFTVHRNKGGWKHKTDQVLVDEMFREVKELSEAVKADEVNREHIISECADVANYCAMLIDNLKG
jgi:hypothetical protein